MKSVITLGLALVLLTLSAPLFAAETSETPAVAAVDAAATVAEPEILASEAEPAPIVLFELPLAQAASATVCYECTSSSQCTAPCGGFGMCARDFDNACDVDPFTKVCHCG